MPRHLLLPPSLSNPWVLVSYNLGRHLPNAVSPAGFIGGRREMIYRRKMGVIKIGLLYLRLFALGFIPTTLLSSRDKWTLGSLFSTLSQLTLLNWVAHSPKWQWVHRSKKGASEFQWNFKKLDKVCQLNLLKILDQNVKQALKCTKKLKKELQKFK